MLSRNTCWLQTFATSLATASEPLVIFRIFDKVQRKSRRRFQATRNSFRRRPRQYLRMGTRRRPPRPLAPRDHEVIQPDPWRPRLLVAGNHALRIAPSWNAFELWQRRQHIRFELGTTQARRCIAILKINGPSIPSQQNRAVLQVGPFNEGKRGRAPGPFVLRILAHS